METYCVSRKNTVEKCCSKKNTANKNSGVKRTKQNILMFVSDCSICSKKKMKVP